MREDPAPWDRSGTQSRLLATLGLRVLAENGNSSNLCLLDIVKFKDILSLLLVFLFYWPGAEDWADTVSFGTRSVPEVPSEFIPTPEPLHLALLFVVASLQVKGLFLETPGSSSLTPGTHSVQQCSYRLWLPRDGSDVQETIQGPIVLGCSFLFLEVGRM